MEPKSGLKTPRILLIEDTVFFRKMYCDMLHNAGYDIDEASDGLEGIQKAQENPPDLILLDLTMPKLDGAATLEKLKGDSRTNQIKVMVLSGRDTAEDVGGALHRGAVDYLVKAKNNPAEVLQKIKNVLQEDQIEASKPTVTRSTNDRYATYRIFIRDRDGDTDKLVSNCSLSQRFWCPKCQEELFLELTPASGLKPVSGQHKFNARLVCPSCGNEF